MADRYQDRPPPADGYDRGDDRHGSARAESDPLAELARLIGQTDPFAVTSMPRANLKAQPRAAAPEPDPYRSPAETYDEPPPGPPSWLQRANRQADPPAPEPEPDYSRSVHPLHRYAAQQAAQDVQQDYQPQDYREEPAYPETDEQPDPSRYDEALYGQIQSGAQDYQREPAYPDDLYAYQEEAYDEGLGEPEQKRRGMMTVAAILALAVVGTGAALAYRTYMGSPRSSEPPIIKADNTPTKIVPAPADGSAKVPDRMAATDGTEKIVPREEAPVDVNAKVGGPRVVFPPLNPNANPPTPASVAPSNMPVATSSQGPSNGTLPNSEPRRIKTLSVPGDQQDSPAVPPPAAKPAPAKTTAAAAPRNPSQANASANAPLSLAPQPRSAPAEAPTRVAATNPAQVAPPAAGGGGYMVQISAQRNEADAHASYRAMQSKFPAVLGSHTPVIKRADLGDKGVFYRAMVGPFGTADEAAQFCGNLKNAGGQCVIHRN